MVSESISLDSVIDFLNEWSSIDPHAAIALVLARVPCNDATLKHKTIQAGYKENNINSHPEVGFLGVLNGLFGIFETGDSLDGAGPIAIKYDNECGRITFARTDSIEMREFFYGATTHEPPREG